MRTYVYCLLPASAEPPPAPPAAIAGVLGAPVRALACGAITAWVSDAPPPDESREASTVVARARAHDAVSQAALDAGATPLPARFGQTYADDAACAHDLASRADAFARALARVHDTVEMTLLVPVADESVDAPLARSAVGGPGRAYLETVRRRLAPEMLYRTSAARRRITETVGALVRDEIVAVTPSSPVAPLALLARARVAHLVPRALVVAYRDALATLVSAPDATDALRDLRVLGPFAPYSFAHMELDGDA